MSVGRAQRWTGPLTVAALCTATFLAGPAALQALRYDRVALAHGQGWRLVGCSVVHLSGWHVLMDLAGLVLLCMLSPRQWSIAGWMARLCWTSVGMSALLWWGWPQVDTYAGLSGPLYGLCVIALSPPADRITRSALAVLALGIVAELVVGSPAWEERLVGGHIVAESHLAGAVAGCGWLVAQAAWRRIGQRGEHRLSR